jgi:exosortase
MKKKLAGNILTALSLALFVIIYRFTILWLFERYTSVSSYYSHGFLVPIVSGILIWLKRKELRNIQWEYSERGLLLIVFSLSLHFIGTLIGVFFLSGFSILFLALGVSLYLFGSKVTKKILFPLIFLFFMLPLPLVVIHTVSFPMRMFVTKSTVFILGLFTDIPLKNEGFQLFFPKGTLVVEDPCSGLRSVMVMLALSSIFAYFLKANALKRSLLFLLAFPIAIISNLARVILLCFVVFVYGGEKVIGFFHDFTAYLVFVIAFFGLWFCWKELQ